MSVPRINLLRPQLRKNVLLAAVLVGLLGLMLIDWDEWPSALRRDERIALADVPAPVRSTSEQMARGGAVQEIEKTSIDGKTAYTANVLVNGAEQETQIGEDGRMISSGAAKDDN